jgi:hypothetical protein
MRALREKYSKYGDYHTVKTHHADELRPVYESYNAAVKTLSRRLSYGGVSAAGAALQCCQLFISIEVMLHNYVAAMQHLAQGLRIMRDWRVRAYVDNQGRLAAPVNSDLPQVDVFALMIYLTPCPGSRRIAERSRSDGQPRSSSERTLLAIVQDPERTEHIRKGKSELHDIANAAFDLLSNSTRPNPASLALGDTKNNILHQLEVWTCSTKHLRQKDGTVWPVRIDEVAMFLFHQVLRVIITSCVGSMEDTPTVELEIANMMSLAQILTNIRSEDLRSDDQ